MGSLMVKIIKFVDIQFGFGLVDVQNIVEPATV